MTQRTFGGRVVSVTTATVVSLFTAAELAGVSELNPLEVIIRNTHATSRLDLGAADVASTTGYGLLALATFSVRLRSPSSLVFAISTTTTISVEIAWSGPFNGT